MLVNTLHTLVARERDCESVSDECPVTESFYGYAPSYPPNIALLVLFGLALFVHSAQGYYYRTWGTLIAFSLGCLSEVIGYGGRIMMHNNAYDLNGFLLQICCISLAPAFFSAAIYLCLSGIVRLYGESFARLKANQYTYIFVACDILSLALQGAGGGLSSVAAQNNEDPTTGDNVMMAGLSFQVFSLLLFAIATIDYYLRVRQRYQNQGPPQGAHPRIRWFYAALGLSYTCIMIRCIYRVIELSNGWNSSLMKRQTDFVILEGIMIVVAVYILNIFHPGQYLFTRNKAPSAESEEEEQKSRIGSES
ncbi:hypothetical protein MMC07_005765 [Pseudocyphellaria aurata]|nr:hypothetical protein [Pseudocyphellaria aurata]